ncbi:MAG: CBS domain-containing protein [Promethearchaeota archaeon]
MKIETVMSEPCITVDKDQLISHALDLMEKNEISQLLITDEDKFVGLLTEKSIADRLGSSRLDSLQASSIHISAAMISTFETVSPETDIESAAGIMLKTGRSALPVLENNELKGIITTTDMIRLCAEVQDIFTGQIMKKDVFTIAPQSRVVHARRLMIDRDLVALPVIESDKLVGLVSERTIAYAMGAFREIVPGRHQDARIKHLLVIDIMRQNPPSVHPDAKVADAAKAMLEERVKALPVLNYEDRLVGILYPREFALLVSRKFTKPD